MSRNPDRCPTHPGELLREDVIPATGKSKTEIARMLGISRQHLRDLSLKRETCLRSPRSKRRSFPGSWIDCKIAGSRNFAFCSVSPIMS